MITIEYIDENYLTGENVLVCKQYYYYDFHVI